MAYEYFFDSLYVHAYIALGEYLRNSCRDKAVFARSMAAHRDDDHRSRQERANIGATGSFDLSIFGYRFRDVTTGFAAISM